VSPFILVDNGKFGDSTPGFDAAVVLIALISTAL